MNVTIPMTPSGFSRLEQELRKLKSEDRPAVIQAIQLTMEMLRIKRLIEALNLDRTFKNNLLLSILYF